jgi:hypothetical protein
MVPKMTCLATYPGGSRTSKTNPPGRGKSHLRGEKQKIFLQIGSLSLREPSVLQEDSLMFLLAKFSISYQDAHTSPLHVPLPPSGRARLEPLIVHLIAPAI